MTLTEDLVIRVTNSAHGVRSRQGDDSETRDDSGALKAAIALTLVTSAVQLLWVKGHRHKPARSGAWLLTSSDSSNSPGPCDSSDSEHVK